MLRLITGSPGDGKTSNELWDFLHNPLYQGRPKYCTPVNGFEPEKHGVVAIEHISGWQDLPDGSVVFCDEVQDYCGTDLGKEPPEWAKQLARHRHRGFDFVFTTQSPMFLHAFVRKLCKPHVHYIRPWNMKGYQYSWDTVQNDPNAKSSKAMGTRKSVAPNPEVFKLYTSTVLDTHKARPPWKIIIGLTLFASIALVGIIWGGFRVASITKTAEPKEVVTKHQNQEPEPVRKTSASFGNPLPATDGQAPRWTKESMTPTIAGLPYTAPVYDELTAPTDFPRVAACIQSTERGSCNCYTQQATPIAVPDGACVVFVKYGTFDPWLSGRNQQLASSPGRQSPASAQPIQTPTRPPQESTSSAFTVVEDHSRQATRTKTL